MCDGMRCTALSERFVIECVANEAPGESGCLECLKLEMAAAINAADRSKSQTGMRNAGICRTTTALPYLYCSLLICCTSIQWPSGLAILCHLWQNCFVLSDIWPRLSNGRALQIAKSLQVLVRTSCRDAAYEYSYEYGTCTVFARVPYSY